VATVGEEFTWVFHTTGEKAKDYSFTGLPSDINDSGIITSGISYITASRWRLVRNLDYFARKLSKKVDLSLWQLRPGLVKLREHAERQMNRVRKHLHSTILYY